MVGLLRPRTVYLKSNECASFSISLRCDFSVSSSPYCTCTGHIIVNFSIQVKIYVLLQMQFREGGLTVGRLLTSNIQCTMNLCSKECCMPQSHIYPTPPDKHMRYKLSLACTSSTVVV